MGQVVTDYSDEDGQISLKAFLYSRTRRKTAGRVTTHEGMVNPYYLLLFLFPFPFPFPFSFPALEFSS